MNLVELLGYLGSALVVTSLAMRSVVKLRIISLAGAVVFVAYGVLIGSWPLMVANAAILGINGWQLRRELIPSQSMAAVPIDADAPFLRDFLSAHASDIKASQPEYLPAPKDQFVRLLTRDGLPAGVVIAEPSGTELLIHLDYVTASYRDSQLARWLFGEGRRTFTDEGFTRVVTRAQTPVHRHYLEFVGFHREGEDYTLDLR